MPFDSSAVTTRPHCMLCPAAPSCMVQGSCAEDLARWNALAQRYVSLAEGRSLFEEGDAASSLHVVRAGCLKSCSIDGRGQERVRAFHLPGDIIGLDALGSERFPCSVLAVQPSQLCRFSREQLLNLLCQSPALMHKFLQRTGRELDHALTMAGDYTAEQRVAAFLLSLQKRLGSADGALRLPMPRRDIANYLRLATETVCRVLTRFEAKGWIAGRDRKLTLRQEEGLRRSLPTIRLAAAA